MASRDITRNTARENTYEVLEHSYAVVHEERKLCVCENPQLIHVWYTSWYLALFKSWSVRRQRALPGSYAVPCLS
jgi:hypothetical protein